jgi:hypothetical protein
LENVAENATSHTLTIKEIQEFLKEMKNDNNQDAKIT